MSHAVVFQSLPMVSTRLHKNPSNPKLSPRFNPLSLRRGVGVGFLPVRAAASCPPPPSLDGNTEALERLFAESVSVPDSFSAGTYGGGGEILMKGGGKYGSLGAVTLEKGKLDNTQKQQTMAPPELATGGGDGGIGKGLFHGGGDGGDDGGDDDDYFDDFDDDEEGDEGGLFRRRKVLQELFDRKFIEAVLNEWQKTMMDLPAGLRQAVEMGLVSSAQLVRVLAINARPTTERLIARALPQGISRGFIGRMIADPAFLYKLLLDQAATIGFSVWLEVQNRKERIKEEWDLALVNVLTASACNAIVVWSLAPCRSYGNTFRFDLQNTLQKLPNNVFEKSYPLREFDMQKRIHSFIYKAAELCTVGLAAGAVQGGLSNLLASKKKERSSLTMPSVSTNALGYGAFVGLYANLRYQLLCGFDRATFNYFDVIGVPMVFSTALRVLNVQLGERSRLAWLGVEAHSNDHSKASNRTLETASSSKSWLPSKDAFVSGLSHLGFKQGDSAASGETPTTKPKRKRMVKKKKVSSS